MHVGGVTRLTTIDYPGMLSLVVFCQGCTWNCGYCHNQHLIPLERDNLVPWENILALLDKRKTLLDAVVFSGGEPLLQDDLEDAMLEVRVRGFLVGLHTSGARPSKFARLLSHHLVDWVGLDIKADWGKYSCITGNPGSGKRARQSAMALVNSDVDYELRTVVDSCHKAQIDIDQIKSNLRLLGADMTKYVVRQAKVEKLR